MTRQKLLRWLVSTVVGFTIAHGLLSFLIASDPKLYDSISLHYSDDFTWYLIFFLLPLLAGLAFSLWLMNKRLSLGLRMLFWSVFVLQIAFTLVASTKNYRHWGYAFKRPAVFKEIQKADRVLAVAHLSPIWVDSIRVSMDTIRSMDELYFRRDLYFNPSGRVFMALQDRAHVNGHLNDPPEVYNDPGLKATTKILKGLIRQIQESNLIDTDPQAAHLQGTATELLTDDNVHYVFVWLDGGEVSNDHYSHHEFLFVRTNNQYELIKKQRFYTDLAGYEGYEYANMAPFFSLFLTGIGLVAAILIGTTNGIIRFIKRRKEKKGRLSTR